MKSTALLLILVMMSLAPSLRAAPRKDIKKNFKRDIGETVKAIAEEISDDPDMMSSFFKMLPKVGKIIASFIQLWHGDKKFIMIKDEIEALSQKLSNVESRLAEKIDIGKYSDVETNINNQFSKFKLYMDNCANNNYNKDKIDQLTTDYFTVTKQQAEGHLSTLLKYFDTKTTDCSNLPETLITQCNCHEKELLALHAHVMRLVQKAFFLVVVEYIEELDNAVVTQAKLQFATALTALLDRQEQCHKNIDEYVKKDVLANLAGATDTERGRKEVTLKIRADLKEKYFRYDWNVFVFQTRGGLSEKISKVISKKIPLSQSGGFSTIQSKGLDVVVAKQVKGGYSKAKKLKDKFKKCLKGKVLKCMNLKKVFGSCATLSNTYTAFHTYSESDDPKAATTTEDEVDYLFKGKCALTRVSVLIKSDKELKVDNPCNAHKCQNRGTCKEVIPFALGRCECNKDHYGAACESKYSDLVKDMREEIEAITPLETADDPPT